MEALSFRILRYGLSTFSSVLNNVHCKRSFGPLSWGKFKGSLLSSLLGGKPGAVHFISEFSQQPSKPRDGGSEKSENQRQDTAKALELVHFSRFKAKGRSLVLL